MATWGGDPASEGTDIPGTQLRAAQPRNVAQTFDFGENISATIHARMKCGRMSVANKRTRDFAVRNDVSWTVRANECSDPVL